MEAAQSEAPALPPPLPRPPTPPPEPTDHPPCPGLSPSPRPLHCPGRGGELRSAQHCSALLSSLTAAERCRRSPGSTASQQPHAMTTNQASPICLFYPPTGPSSSCLNSFPSSVKDISPCPFNGGEAKRGARGVVDCTVDKSTLYMYTQC